MVNAELIVKHTTAHPFRLPGNGLAIVCVYCKGTFQKSESFRNHMNENHTTFQQQYNFKHVSKNCYLKVDCTNLQCRLCCTQFPKLYDIAKHLSENHNFDLDIDAGIALCPYNFSEEKFICGICDQKCTGMRTLSRHISTHFQNVTCEKCGKMYMSASSLIGHMKLSHATAKYPCSKCNKPFETMKERRDHVANTQACWNFRCVSCDISFKTYKIKLQHMMNTHGAKKKIYPCTDCSLEFSRSDKLLRHFKLTHSLNNIQICCTCGKKFYSKRYLNEHVISHTGLTNFECLECPKKFSRKKSLQRHVKNRHPKS